MIIEIGSKNIRCSTRGKGPHVCGLVPEGVAVSEICKGKGQSVSMKE